MPSKTFEPCPDCNTTGLIKGRPCKKCKGRAYLESYPDYKIEGEPIDKRGLSLAEGS